MLSNLMKIAEALELTVEELQFVDLEDTWEETSEEIQPPEHRNVNILPLMKVIIGSKVEEVTIDDLLWLLSVQKGLPSEIPKSLVTDLLKERHKD